MTSTAVVVNLHRSIIEGKNAYEIRKWYKEANRIMLPRVDEVPEYVNDHVLSSLYEEIWFRQLFAEGSSSPTAKQRIYSCFNYSRIFQFMLLGATETSKLPYQWLWDMMDGYVNQFQSFCQYRPSENKTPQDVYLLTRRTMAFSVHAVLNTLHRLVRASEIIQKLELLDKDGLLQLLTATEEHNVLSALGYFSLVGLLRVHCLLGSYQDGLDCVRYIDIIQQEFHPTLIATQITTIYHYGFANLMLGRYVDAIRGFNKILAYIFKRPQQESPQILNKIEQMYALLAICLSLYPQHQLVDENVYSHLMEKYGEKLWRMQRHNDAALYLELLSYAWPTFSTPFAANFGDPYQKFDKDGLVCYELPTPFAASFGPCASKSLVNHDPLQAVIADMQCCNPRPTPTLETFFKSARISRRRSKSVKTWAQRSKVGLGFSKSLLKLGHKSIKNHARRSKVGLRR